VVTCTPADDVRGTVTSRAPRSAGDADARLQSCSSHAATAVGDAETTSGARPTLHGRRLVEVLSLQPYLLIYNAHTEASRGVVGRGRGGTASPTFFDRGGRVPHVTPTFLD